MICSGNTSNFALTPARSSRLPVMVLTSEMRASTSWAMSLSPVEITTSSPTAAARCASVPITSSASTPGMRNSGRPSASTASISGSTCARRSSGIGARLALYSI